MSPTEAVARFVATTKPDEIPAAARAAAVRACIDTYATAHSGAPEQSNQVLRKALLPWAGAGGSSLVGDPDTKVAPPTAALVNAAAAHALDFDAISYAAVGFTGSATIAALTAISESSPTPYSGRDVITAFCLGWEAAAAIGRGVNPLHYAKGWHPTATLSLFAAALGSARLLGLDTERTALALGIAVSEASGVKTMIGNMTNPWHVGKSARNGVVAARMAADGFVAHPGALEAKYGFLNLFEGEGQYDSDAIVNSLGNPWDLLEPGPVVKIYPCCGLIHTGLDAILELQAEQEIDLDAIEEVVVSLHEYVPGVMFIDVPETGYQAKFSVPYTVALALIDGRVGVDSFQTVRPEVVELGRKVRMAVHPDLHGGETFWEKEFTEIDVVTRSGTRTKRINRLDNRGIGRNLSDDDLRTKLAENLRYADPSTPGTRAEQDWERLVNADSAEPWRYW